MGYSLRAIHQRYLRYARSGIKWASARETQAPPELLILCCILIPWISWLIPDNNSAWTWYNTTNAASKAVLCLLVAHGRKFHIRTTARSAAIWFAGQAIIEYTTVIGCEDGKSAHGIWEVYLFLLLVVATIFTLVHHDHADE